jgi:hypothetical protein
MNYSLNEQMLKTIFDKVKQFILPSEFNGYKSPFLQSKILFYFALILVILKLSTVLLSLNLPVNIFFADITKSSLENFVNQTRLSLGLKELSGNSKLDQAAKLKAQNMINDQYFSHTSPSGITPWYWFLKAGYNYKYAGENLAIGFFESREVFQAWLNSSSHKANIINPKYTEMGTAVLSGFGDQNTIVVVQEFASPAPMKQPTTQKLSKNNDQTISVKEQTLPAVLSQTDDSQDFLQKPIVNAKENLISKFLNYVIYDYQNILQKIIYLLILVILCAIIIVLSFSYKITLKHNFVFRVFILIVALSIAALIDQSIIVSLVPHQIQI